MRTNNSHAYHGVTLRNDGYGWTIQIKLLGRYHQLRTFASNAETAARRHDIALCKLEGFTEASALPNFPDDFAAVELARSFFHKDDGGLDFYDGLHSLFSSLCKEAESAGLDPMEMANHKREAAKAKQERAGQKRALARASFTDRLFKLRDVVPSLGLSADKTKQVSDMLTSTQTVFENATKI